MAFKDQGKFDEAIEAYKKSISLKPNYAEVYNNLGVVFNLKVSVMKLYKFNKSILLKSDYAEAYTTHMGSCSYRNQGKLDEAMEGVQQSYSHLSPIMLKPITVILASCT